MRIALWYNLPAGGGKRAVRDQVEGLLARGHSVEVWTTSAANRSFMALPQGVVEHVLPLSWSEPKGGRLARWGRPWAYARRLRMVREHADRVARETRGFDILLAHSCMWYAAPHVASASAIPCAVYLHEPFRGLHEAGSQAPTWFGPAAPTERQGALGRFNEVLEYWRDLVWQRAQVREEWRNARAATTLLVNSWFTSESAMRTYGRRGTVCEPGVDIDAWDDPGYERDPVVVGLGAVTAHKGVLEAIETMSAMDAQARSGSRLVWFGQMADADYLETIRRVATERGVDFDVRIGRSEEEIRTTLQKARAFLYPTRLEPFGYAPLEAAACGCPSVAIREGGPRETLVDGETAFLTDGTREQMASALGRLLLDPGLVRSMGIAGRRRVCERYSMPASIDRLEAQLAKTARTP